MLGLDQLAALFHHVALSHAGIILERAYPNTLVGPGIKIELLSRKSSAQVTYTRFYNSPAQKWVWMGSGEVYTRDLVTFDPGTGEYRQEIQMRGHVDVVLEEFQLFCEMMEA